MVNYAKHFIIFTSSKKQLKHNRLIKRELNHNNKLIFNLLSIKENQMNSIWKFYLKDNKEKFYMNQKQWI
jgi:hypothetical protein